MSASDITLGVLGTLMGVVALISLPRTWRGYFIRAESRYRGKLRTHGELTFIWWPFGEATRRGAIRGVVALFFAWWAAMLGYWSLAVSTHSQGSVSHATRIFGWVFFACFAVNMVLCVTVMFFNWPKFIVPPHQRSELGAASEWRARRHERGARSP